MKPLRGKRVGSAQSARRIQPGDGSGLAGSPADLSRSPFLPTSPPPLPPTLTALPFVSGQKWAALRAHFHQGYAPRPAPGRLGRMAGKGAQGSPPLRWRAHHPRVLQPPGSSACQIPGLREPDLWPRSPCSRRSPPRVTSVFFGGPGRPSKHATAFPSRPASNLVGRAGADCSQCSLGRSHRRARGLFLGHAGQQSERTGSASMLATQPTRLETQTKESNTCVSQGLARKPPWCNEGKGCLSRRPRWDPEASPVCRWSTTGLSCPLRWGGGAWSQVLGPERW